MELKKYVIKKGNTSLLSSLKALNESVLKECMEEYDADDINELEEFILEEFEMLLEECTDDLATRIYFERLLQYENSDNLFAYEDDIKKLIVFAYKNDDHYSYYVPNEIKKIIKKLI